MEFQPTSNHLKEESPGPLELVMAKIEDVIWCRDLETQKMVYISPGYEKVWERSCESLIQNSYSFLEAILPEDRKLLENLASGMTGECLVYRIHTPSGKMKWIRDRVFEIRAESL